MPNERWEACLAGSGGQGIITAGVILAEAAVVAGLNAVQTQSYGPESRGGASRAEVVISKREIDYPKTIAPDLLLAMTAEAATKYAGRLKAGGLLIADDEVTTIPPGSYSPVVIPISRTATEELGRAILANIVALGVVVVLTRIVPVKSLEEAMLARVPKGTEALNRRALSRGLQLGEEAMQVGHYR